MNIQITPSRLCAFVAAILFILGFFQVQAEGMDGIRWALLGLFFLATGIVLG